MLTHFDNKINDEFSLDTDYLSLIRSIMNNLKEPPGVNELVNAFQNLHRILLTNEELFIHIFGNVYDQFDKFLLNENPEIVKACLIVTSDLLGKSWLIQEIKDWVVYLIPLLLTLSDPRDGPHDEYTNILISKCLENIPKFCFYEETALTLLNEMTNKNSDYTDRACELFKNFIRCSEISYIIDVFEWNEIFDNIFWIYNIDKKKQKIAETIIYFFHNEIFSNEEWEDVLSKLDDTYLHTLTVIANINYSSVYQKKKKLQANKIICDD